MPNPFRQSKNWHLAYDGAGRKIHCRTVFIRNLKVLLDHRGFKTEIVGDSVVLRYKLAGMDMAINLRLVGNVAYIADQFPFYDCAGLIEKAGRQKQRHYIKAGRYATNVRDYITVMFPQALSEAS